MTTGLSGPGPTDDAETASSTRHGFLPAQANFAADAFVSRPCATSIVPATGPDFHTTATPSVMAMSSYAFKCANVFRKLSAWSMLGAYSNPKTPG